MAHIPSFLFWFSLQYFLLDAVNLGKVGLGKTAKGLAN